MRAEKVVCNGVIDRFVAGELNQICASRRRTSAILGLANHRAPCGAARPGVTHAESSRGGDGITLGYSIDCPSLVCHVSVSGPQFGLSRCSCAMYSVLGRLGIQYWCFQTSTDGVGTCEAEYNWNRSCYFVFLESVSAYIQLDNHTCPRSVLIIMYKG
jgi:hypothetical protein